MKPLPRLSRCPLLLCLPLLASAAHGRADLHTRHVTVVDVSQGRTLPAYSVVTNGQDIVAVGADEQLAGQWQTRQEMDAGNRYLTPGPWDMHVHFGGGPALIGKDKALLLLYVAHGVTSGRNAPADLAVQVLPWRGQMADGALLRTQLFTSGATIEGPKRLWQGPLKAGDKAGVGAAQDRGQRDRVDCVKITTAP